MPLNNSPIRVARTSCWWIYKRQISSKYQLADVAIGRSSVYVRIKVQFYGNSVFLEVYSVYSALYTF